MGKPRVCGRGTQVTSLALPHSLTLHALGTESTPSLGTFWGHFTVSSCSHRCHLTPLANGWQASLCALLLLGFARLLSSCRSAESRGHHKMISTWHSAFWCPTGRPNRGKGGLGSARAARTPPLLLGSLAAGFLAKQSRESCSVGEEGGDDPLLAEGGVLNSVLRGKAESGVCQWR